VKPSSDSDERAVISKRCNNGGSEGTERIFMILYPRGST
jgi:hypothetical protein